MKEKNNGFIKKTLAITKSDLSQRSIYIFLLPLIVLLLLFIERHVAPPAALADDFSENIYRLFRGDYRISPELSYQPPIVWIFLNAYLAFAVGGFPFGNADAAILLKTRSRLGWWFSKCASLAATVFLSYFAVYLTVFTVSLIQENGASGFNYASLAAVLLPLCVTLACSFIQASLNLIIKPVFSFAAVISLQIISTYVHTPFLITSYSQLMRTKLSGFGKISPAYAIPILLGITAVCIIAGAFAANRIDYVSKKE